MSTTDDFEWNVIYESRLLDAMHGHKPVGINKYFQMAFICDKFTDNINKDVDPERVWAHLATMYNLEALDEGEAVPFPNAERDFNLPETEFGPLISTRREEEQQQQQQQQQRVRETPGAPPPPPPPAPPRPPPRDKAGDGETKEKSTSGRPPKETPDKDRDTTGAGQRRDSREGGKADGAKSAGGGGGKKDAQARKDAASEGPGGAKSTTGSGTAAATTTATTPASDKPKAGKGRPKEDGRTKGARGGGGGGEETGSAAARHPQPQTHSKRPTRGSLRPDDSASSGKSSPVTTAPATPVAAKRRRAL